MECELFPLWWCQLEFKYWPGWIFLRWVNPEKCLSALGKHDSEPAWVVATWSASGAGLHGCGLCWPNRRLLQLGNSPGGNPSFRQVIIPVREGGDLWRSSSFPLFPWWVKQAVHFRSHSNQAYLFQDVSRIHFTAPTTHLAAAGNSSWRCR